MRLPNGITLDAEKTFGTLKFSAMRRERFMSDEDGTPTSEITERTYDLKSLAQGQMIQVSLPEKAGTKDFSYNQIVSLVNPVIDTVANADFRGVTTSWYLKADDIVIANEKGKVSEKVNNDRK